MNELVVPVIDDGAATVNELPTIAMLAVVPDTGPPVSELPTGQLAVAVAVHDGD